MKPLWNSPSLGTFRAGEARAVNFLVVVFGVVILFTLFILAPLGLVLRSAWGKRPLVIWRTAVSMSVALSLLLILPMSPLRVAPGVPFSIPADPFTTSEFAVFAFYLIPWINIAVIAELPLLPIAFATSIHTARTRAISNVRKDE